MKPRADTPCDTAPATRRRSALSIALVVVAAALVYANSLDVDFIYDDYAFVYNNEAIRTFTPFSKFLLSNETFSQPANDHVYRPLAAFTFAINYALDGLNPVGYHLVNTIFHILNAILVFILLRRLRFSDGPAFVGSLFFAIHPVHTEAVTWIAGRGNVLYLFFFLIAYMLYIESDASSRGRRLVLLCGSTVAYGFALLAKEMALPFPALLFGYDLYFHPEWNRSQRLRRVWIYSPFVLTAVAYILVRSHVLGKVAQVSYHGGSAYMTFLLMMQALVIYARLLFVPVGLSLSRHFLPVYSVFDMSVLPSFCAVLGAVAAGVLTFRRKKLISFALFWFAVTMLPVSNIIPVNAIVADRFLYGPSIGFCIIVAVWVTAFSGNKGSVKKLSSVAAVSIVFSYMVLSIGRNTDWSNSVVLWSKTARAFPTSFTAFNNLGFEYMKHGQIADAIDALNKAIEIKHDLPEAHLNLALCYEKTNRLGMAIHHYETALPYLDKKAETRYQLGLLLERTGNIDRAIDQYEEALAENPNLIEAHRRLAVLYRTRDKARAIEHYSAVLAADPGDADAYLQLAHLYYASGDVSKAIEILRKSISVNPANNSAREFLERIHRNSVSQAGKISD